MNDCVMTEQEFINKEIAIWGEDYIFNLVDRGYKAACLISRSGEMKWSWVLTQPDPHAIMRNGSGSVFTPVSQGSRL